MSSGLGFCLLGLWRMDSDHGRARACCALQAGPVLRLNLSSEHGLALEAACSPCEVVQAGPAVRLNTHRTQQGNEPLLSARCMQLLCFSGKTSFPRYQGMLSKRSSSPTVSRDLLCKLWVLSVLWAKPKAPFGFLLCLLTAFRFSLQLIGLGPHNPRKKQDLDKLYDLKAKAQQIMNQFGPSTLINLSNFSSIKPEPASTPPQSSMANSTAVAKMPGTPSGGGRLSPESNQVTSSPAAGEMLTPLSTAQQWWNSQSFDMFGLRGCRLLPCSNPALTCVCHLQC